MITKRQRRAKARRRKARRLKEWNKRSASFYLSRYMELYGQYAKDATRMLVAFASRSGYQSAGKASDT